MSEATYDISLDPDSQRPPDGQFFTTYMPVDIIYLRGTHVVFPHQGVKAVVKWEENPNKPGDWVPSMQRVE